MKIGFIGMGNMGYAILKGILKTYDPGTICFSCKTEEKRIKITSETGVQGMLSNADVVNEADLIILAIKPQMFDEVFPEIKQAASGSGKIFVSLAPGKLIADIAEKLGGGIRVVRAMPNTPALIGYGVSGVAYDKSLFNEEEQKMIEGLFSAIGTYELVDEDQISAVICASGSTPAYIYMFIDELAKAASSKGIPYEKALNMVSNTMIGAARMVLQSEDTPEILKQKVCSKGGTTIEGVKVFENMGLSEMTAAATDACYKRAEELSK